MTTYVSLFAGAGGFDLGAQKAGLTPRLILDASRDCIETIRNSQQYQYAHKSGAGAALAGDIRYLLADKRFAQWPADIVIGAPPCRGLIVAGKADPNDPGCEPVFQFMDAVGQVRPAAFVMEGLATMTGPAWSLVMNRLRSQAERLGYDTYVLVLDAKDYGLAQARKRMFLYGVPPGSSPVTVPPRKLTSVMGLNPARYVIGSWTTHEHDANIHPKARITLARNPVLRSSPYAGMLLNGGGRVFDLDKPAPTLTASMGGNNTPVYDVCQLRHGAEPWIIGYHRDLTDGEPPLRELPPHVNMRRLSFREAAALQGFPSKYPFYGSARSCWQQVGNAVPPLLAEVAVQALLDSLK